MLPLQLISRKPHRLASRTYAYTNCQNCIKQKVFGITPTNMCVINYLYPATYRDLEGRGSGCYLLHFFPDPVPVQRHPQQPTGYHAATMELPSSSGQKRGTKEILRNKLYLSPETLYSSIASSGAEAYSFSASISSLSTGAASSRGGWWVGTLLRLPPPLLRW